MEIGNITLIIGETYYTRFGSIIQKLKLDKIHHEKIEGNRVQVTVRAFSERSNEKSVDAWSLWSSEIYHTREEAKKGPS